MCGIVAYIGEKQAGPILLEGLKRLEYRGYDSSGLALLNASAATYLEKAVGQIARLEKKIDNGFPESHCGIAHTRWATHGGVTEPNAHPHCDCRREIFVVHNGIIENFAVLKKKLQQSGHQFTSETDTEVIAHLLEEVYQGDLLQAVQEVLRFLQGTYGLAILHGKHPQEIIIARRGSPMVIGKGQSQCLAASDPHALVGEAEELVYLEDNEVARITASGCELVTTENVPVNRLSEKLHLDPTAVEKNHFPHYMLKEIFEQPRVVEDTLRGRINQAAASAKLGGLESVRDRLQKARQLIFVSCGTSYHASLFGKYLFSELTNIPVEAELASEFRYRRVWLDPESVVLTLSQSGETADSLAALRLAKEQGALTLGVVNVVSSTIARETDAGVYMHAGPEIGVASTKAFLSQLTLLLLMAVYVGRRRGLSSDDAGPILRELEAMPEKIRQVLSLADQIKDVAERYARYDHFLYVGRQYQYPIALEGALKLKEISYIHAEAYAAGEMKHGSIALIDPNFPTVALAPRDRVYAKSLSNIEEIRARNGPVIAVGTEGDEGLQRLAEEVIYVPATEDPLYALLTTVVLQLFAYYCAAHRGCEIDKPRNLAKSVTVE
ncbi:MAG TPA: glutamine--fructose-6-phosphate transaminase (isomerizing) [Candidatus Acidoferrales bacterium]|nr:glutamine--fructose-6-phosphate transaminase (isomerizing) [Candidatus Acidoferrales bacterium]